jgi:hypothetical protein
MGTETVDFVLNDTTPQARPISGALVKVFSEGEVVSLTEAVTDNLGKVSFLLESGITYQARFAKARVSFRNPQLFRVEEPPTSNVFTVQGQLLASPMSNDPRLCLAYGYFRQSDGSPAQSILLTLTPKFNPLLLEGAVVVTSDPVHVVTDARGYAQVSLIRCGLYEVRMQGSDGVVRTITVPDAPNVSLPELLFPVVSDILFTPADPFAIAVGSDLEVTPTVIASDGQVLEGTANEDLIWKSSNSAVLGVFTSGGKVVLRGLGAGTAQLQAVRQDSSVIHYPDYGIEGVPVDVVVT